MLYGIESGSLAPTSESEYTEPEHIEPEQMLDALAKYICDKMEQDDHPELIPELLEIYFKYSLMA